MILQINVPNNLALVYYFIDYTVLLSMSMAVPMTLKYIFFTNKVRF